MSPATPPKLARTSAKKQPVKRPAKELAKDQVKGKFVVRNDKGLHTRPCTELVKCAALYTSEIFLSYQGNRVNAKSLLGLLMLAAPYGSRIAIEAEGRDAQEAVSALVSLAESSFHMKY